MKCSIPHADGLQRSGRGLAVLLLLVPLAGCFHSSDNTIRAAETAVLEKVRTSSSVKFAYERVIHNQQTIVCGLVNTRQPSGKATGWRRFYVAGEPQRAWIDIGEARGQSAFKVTAGPPGSVSYEYLWNTAGCRNSDVQPGVMQTADRIFSWFDG
jgi:hypothetical protein